MTIKPKKLVAGDKVRLVSPASAPDPDRVASTVEYPQSLGLRVEVGRHALDRFGLFAGTDDVRLADLDDALRDPEKRAVIAARGGRGAYRIADGLDAETACRDPKLLVGFSEITISHTARLRHGGIAGVHGAPWSDDVDPSSAESFRRTLFRSEPIVIERDADEPTTALDIEGVASGVLIGGDSLGAIGVDGGSGARTTARLPDPLPCPSRDFAPRRRDMGWTEGDWIVRREVLPNGPWLGVLVKVIEDSAEHLISYIPEGAPFGFPDGDWHTPNGKHPWADRACWQGHGCLMIQEPGSAHAVWHFWHGPERAFDCWYMNLQEPFRRTAIGYDTQDLELDLVVRPDGTWRLKDDELMDLRVRQGLWTAERVAEIRSDGARIAERLDEGERWWPLKWRHWKPDPSWVVPSELPDGWEAESLELDDT